MLRTNQKINVGVGLLDYLVKPQIDSSTGETLVDFGVENDPENDYRRFRTPNCEYDAIYKIKANAPMNSEAHTNLKVQLTSGKLKLLIDERTAKTKLLGTKVGQTMSPEKRAIYLRPYSLTTILQEELLNLKEESEGANIILKRSNRHINKDKVSALEYGLYYIKQQEEKKGKKKKFKASDYSFMN